jgi:hypothetical protein
MTSELESREAKWGERMIEVKIRFWTDALADKEGSVRPRHAWTSGVVRVTSNSVHGIKSKKAYPFNSLLDVPATVERVLLDHGVKLHASSRMKKYLSE